MVVDTKHNTMDQKSKTMLLITLLAVVLSIGYTFYKTVVVGDFEVIEESSAV